MFDGVSAITLLILCYLSTHVHSASVIVDYSGECIGLTVYNLAESFTFAQGDVVTIPDPCLRRTAVNYSVRPTINNNEFNPICSRTGYSIKECNLYRMLS